MSKTIGVGIIGCGGRIQTVLANVRKVTDNVKLVALCDPLEESIRDTRERFNADAKVYEDYHDLCADPDVDWVMVGSWNCFHAEHTIAGFQAGKHVFCEKPLATTIEDCAAMMDAWRESGCNFSIGFTLRYSPHYRKIRELVDAGEIGYPVSAEMNETLSLRHGGHIMSDWRRLREYTGSHLLEKCCHDIDLANWLCGSLAARVASFGGLNVFVPENKHFFERAGKDDRGRPAYHSWQQPEYVHPFTGEHDVVDNQIALIEYANNVRLCFHTNSHSGIPERRCHIIGSEGTIRADVIRGTIELAKAGLKAEVQDVSAGVRGDHGGGDNILGESLAQSMLEGKPPVTSLEDGLTSAVTVFGIDRAMETGQVVDMAPLWSQVGLELPGD